MFSERLLWLALPEGQKPEDNPRIAMLLQAGWAITESCQRQLLTNLANSRLWVVSLKKKMNPELLPD
jgi:hypothetical protein